MLFYIYIYTREKKTGGGGQKKSPPNFDGLFKGIIFFKNL